MPDDRRRVRPHTGARSATGIALAVIAVVVAGCGDPSGAPSGGGPTSTATTAPPTAGARVYRDGVGDVPAGTPDLAEVRISNDAEQVHLVVRFASAPPLRTSPSGRWTDMLLMGIDVPPIGPGPTPSGWTGLDYALGMHGVDVRARFRPMENATTPGTRPDVRTLESHVRGREIALDLPIAWIGKPAFFDFNVAVGREGEDEASSAGGDQIPGRGTARYTLR